MEPSDRPLRPADPTPRDDRLVELGPIVNCHGIRGELRLLPHNPTSDAAARSADLILLWPDGRRESRHVTAARRHKRFVLLQLDGISDATAAEALVGCTVAIPRTALPPAGRDAVYHADLLGCAVVTTGGQALGTVRQMLSTGSNDICVVHDGTREVLVPMVADVIAEIDIAGRRIVINLLPGLLDDDA